jgi:hypothetical protein
MNGKKNSRRPIGKRPYREPELKVHGDFRKLTAANVKDGTGSDGATKPSTRLSGPTA